jgi:hypothetical protein
MQYRIAMWATVGFLVAGFWAIYLAPTATPIISDNPMIWTLGRFTCPVAIAGQYYPIGLYWALFANAATYALVGLIFETLRKQRHHAK